MAEWFCDHSAPSHRQVPACPPSGRVGEALPRLLRGPVGPRTRPGVGDPEELTSIKKDLFLGLPWQPSGEDSMLPMQGMWVQSVIRELSSHMP